LKLFYIADLLVVFWLSLLDVSGVGRVACTAESDTDDDLFFEQLLFGVYGRVHGAEEACFLRN